MFYGNNLSFCPLEVFVTRYCFYLRLIVLDDFKTYIFWWFGDFINFHKTFLLPGSVDETSHCINFQGHPFKTTPFYLKDPILITLLISFSFNHVIMFCLSIHVTAFINQYSTWLCVSYYSVQRKIQLHKNLFKKYLNSFSLFSGKLVPLTIDILTGFWQCNDNSFVILSFCEIF